MRPRMRGSAPWRAIESVVRAVGRIVVWVDAAADVRTARMSALSSGDGKTRPPRKLSTSSEWSISAFGPGKAAVVAVARLLVDGDARVPPPVDEHREQDPVKEPARAGGG